MPVHNASGALSVDRALVELQRGRAVSVRDSSGSLLVASLERIDFTGRDVFRDDEGRTRLLLTRERALALGTPVVGDAVEYSIPGMLSDSAVATLLGLPKAADALTDACASEPQPAFAAIDPRAEPSLLLARLARVLPVLVCKPVTDVDVDPVTLEVEVEDIARYPEARGRSVERTSCAEVPLAEHVSTRFVLYRERYGDAEHVAIVVGKPAELQPALVRVHSSCLTGDLFASLRCDCGEQLRGAVTQLSKAGGGVLLYLAQEGRGIGLANKLRAYALQDTGLDTLDADRHLGFGGDERRFSAACAMLADLGITRVRLLTNNPQKVVALEAGGIEVVERVPSTAGVTRWNARYLETKRDRSGHLLSSVLRAPAP